MKRTWLLALAGGAAGAVSGLFGAGGGLLLVPLLSFDDALQDADVFSASVAIMGPVCLVSLIQGGPISLGSALPYAIGGLLGGLAAAFWGKKIPVKWLHRLLGIMILWGGVRSLC